MLVAFRPACPPRAYVVQEPRRVARGNSPIVLVDIATGERAPFFAEIDQNTVDVVKRDLIIRPLARLKPGRATSWRSARGQGRRRRRADVPPGFAALLEGKDFRTRGSARSRSGGR